MGFAKSSGIQEKLVRLVNMLFLFSALFGVETYAPTICDNLCLKKSFVDSHRLNGG